MADEKDPWANIQAYNGVYETSPVNGCIKRVEGYVYSAPEVDRARVATEIEQAKLRERVQKLSETWRLDAAKMKDLGHKFPSEFTLKRCADALMELL